MDAHARLRLTDDGNWRWDGKQWVPNQPPLRHPRRERTKRTRVLFGWFAAAGVTVFLALAFITTHVG
ncbi:MAG: hypothetical protein J2P40_14525 [Candidatus Dormibacteraeota bacterium]|nr:hypothetical protein [Candidatus Dormibacteraeota bacterium]MBO0762488.1 hypothetical protein [Candidatus Dormibacteraeota bacterium]